MVRNALTAANARVEDIEARRLELSAELRAAQAASQIFETERFDMLKKVEEIGKQFFTAGMIPEKVLTNMTGFKINRNGGFTKTILNVEYY